MTKILGKSNSRNQSSPILWMLTLLETYSCSRISLIRIHDTDLLVLTTFWIQLMRCKMALRLKWITSSFEKSFLTYQDEGLIKVLILKLMSWSFFACSSLVFWTKLTSQDFFNFTGCFYEYSSSLFVIFFPLMLPVIHIFPFLWAFWVPLMIAVASWVHTNFCSDWTEKSWVLKI